MALDNKGRSRFQLLQEARKAGGRLRYCVFDLMFLDGKDLRRLPLVERKRRLRRILAGGAVIRFSRHITRNGIRAFRSAAERAGRHRRQAGRWTLPVGPAHQRVAENKDLQTTGGCRWKVFTRPGDRADILARSRSRFETGNRGALSAIRHRLQRVEPQGHSRVAKTAGTQSKPVAGKVPNERATTWVKPRLVGEVKFTEWTKQGRMRHPAFVGLRMDKPASRVVRERARKLVRQ